MDENFARGDQRPLVLHVISGLGTGGAELMLSRLIYFAQTVRHAVVSLRDIGPVGAELRLRGASVCSLGLPDVVNLASSPFALRQIIREMRPAVVQGWMTHGNLAAVAAASMAQAPLLWNVRQSLVDFRYEKRLTSAALRLTALLSNKPSAILYNSRVGAEQHEALGYPRERRQIVANGFDTALFVRDDHRRNGVRRSLGIEAETVLVGLIARAHPMKNHAGFFAVAQRVAASFPATKFLLAGSGTDSVKIREQARSTGLADRFLLLGDRLDIPDITRSLDVAMSLSVHGEGFPNTVGEAMASAVPCLVTDIGDSAWILGDGGLVVSPGDLDAATDGLARLVSMSAAERGAIGARGRNRLVANFAIDDVVASYERLYLDLIRDRARAQSLKERT